MVRKNVLIVTALLFAEIMFACNTGDDSGEQPVIPPTEQPEDNSGEKPGDGDTILETPYVIPVYGNAYVTANPGTLQMTEKGIENWKDPNSVVSIFFRVSGTGKLNLAIVGAATSGKSELTVTVGDSVFAVPIDKTTQVYPIGQVMITKAGYVKVQLQGKSKTGSDFGTFQMLKIGGLAAGGTITSVPVKDAYWGRRGPSVHMGYTMPSDDVQYFYNEVTVPLDNDVMNSYFMSNGFGQGYMGMQVNSTTERRILFSVWSPYSTDNPGDIPDGYKIVLLRQGENVTINDFGNEGSGAQSYLRYMWKPGVTYKFLTEVKPDGNGNTDYTGYFFATDDNEWKLIASFRRPHTSTWYTGAHSFLENFNPEMGYVERKVYFNNQWVRKVDGTWHEMTKGRFTCDATGSARIRLDYAGGVETEKFFLQNCGFFDQTTPYGAEFSRKALGVPPVINLDALNMIPSVKK